MLHPKLPHEFDLREFVSRKVEKLGAHVFGYFGADLSLDFADLPRVSEVESAFALLDRWRELSPVADLADGVRDLLQEVHEGVLTPDLFRRHVCFATSDTLIRETPELLICTQIKKTELDALYESSSRIDHVRGYLTSAALRLSFCIAFRPRRSFGAVPGICNETIKDHLKTAVMRINQSKSVGDFFFDYESQP